MRPFERVGLKPMPREEPASEPEDDAAEPEADQH
jgi:hypothetical protein